MNMDLTTGDDFLDKMPKASYVPYENPYDDFFDQFWWEENMTYAVMAVVCLYIVSFGVPFWNYIFYWKMSYSPRNKEEVIAEDATPFRRGDLVIRQWDCSCFGVGMVLLSFFFWYGFQGDTFNYMMCQKDPTNITVSDACTSKMCDWQRELSNGAKTSDVNCLVIRHAMFRTVSTTLLTLKDDKQVDWRFEDKKRSQVMIDGVPHDRNKRLWSVFVKGDNEKGVPVECSLYDILLPYKAGDELGSPLNDTRAAVKTFLNLNDEELEESWHGSMGALWGDLQFRSDGSRFDLRRLRGDMVPTMAFLTSGFLMCCGVWFCESFTFETETGQLVRRRWTGLIYPETATLQRLSSIGKFVAYHGDGYFCFWTKFWELRFVFPETKKNKRKTFVRFMEYGEAERDRLLGELNAWLDEYNIEYEKAKAKQEEARNAKQGSGRNSSGRR